MQLRKPNSAQKVPLVDRQHLLERLALSRGVAELAMGSRQVHPERRRLWIPIAGNLEMGGCGSRILPFQRLKPQCITRRGLIALERNDGFEMLPSAVNEPRLLRALCFGEELRDAGGGHASRLRQTVPPRSSDLKRQQEGRPVAPVV